MTPRTGFDPASLAAGLILIALGGVLLLDQADVIHVRVEYMAPLVLAAIGGILLACGLTGSRRS